MCLLCSCITPGETWLENRKCVQQKACLADTARCYGPGQKCNDFSDGTHNCSCINGYEGNATSCALIDNCRKENVICGQGFCENILNGFQCRCREGYRFENNTCVLAINLMPPLTTSIMVDPYENKNCVHLMLSHLTFWHTVRTYLKIMICSYFAAGLYILIGVLVAVVIALVLVAAVAGFLVYRRRYAKKQVVFSTKVPSSHPLETVSGATIALGASGSARDMRFVDMDSGFRKAPVAGIETLTMATIQNTVRHQLEAAIARRQRFAATAAAARARAELMGSGATAAGGSNVYADFHAGRGPPTDQIYEENP